MKLFFSNYLKLFLLCLLPYFASAGDHYQDIVVLPEPVYTPHIETKFLDSNTKEVCLEKFEDKIVLLHFWATWCAICHVELQELDKLQKFYRKKPLKVIALSEDFKSLSEIMPYLTTREIKYLDPYKDIKMQLMQGLGIQNLPATVIFNKEGLMIAKAVGPVDWGSAEVRSYLDSLVVTHASQ